MKLIARLLLLSLAAVVPAAQAQTGKWPERPVHVIVPFPPGGAPDVLARLLSDKLTAEFGQQFIVENRAGAGGTIGYEFVARAKPDGYTLIVVPTSYTAAPGLYRLPYDPVNGIAPISMIALGPLVLAVHPSVQATDLKEFIALLRANPGTLNYGSPGSGTDLHLAIEYFRQLTGTDPVHVPYKGIAPAITDLLGGRIQFMLGTPLTFATHLKAGKLRAIAVTTEQRSPVLPELPAIGEQVPGYAVDLWLGMWAPAGTPSDTVARVNQSLARILSLPDVQERLRAGGLLAKHSTPEEFSRLIAREIAKWTKVIKAGNVRID
jgi:tripartite-type tricarboxylate transporter receptor subunit TctC